MENIELSHIQVKLPDGVNGIQGDNTMVFKNGNIIQAGCSASGGNVITLFSNSVQKIIDFKCDAYTEEGNRCGNNNVDSDTCLIYSQIIKAT